MEQITEGLMILILGTVDLKTHSKTQNFQHIAQVPLIGYLS